MVKSARARIRSHRPARFPGPLPAPGVPVSRHRALRRSRLVSLFTVRVFGWRIDPRPV